VKLSEKSHLVFSVFRRLFQCTDCGCRAHASYKVWRKSSSAAKSKFIRYWCRERPSARLLAHCWMLIRGVLKLTIENAKFYVSTVEFFQWQSRLARACHCWQFTIKFSLFLENGFFPVSCRPYLHSALFPRGISHIYYIKFW